MFFIGFVLIFFVDFFVLVIFKEVIEYFKYSFFEQIGMKFEFKGVKFICELYCGLIGVNRIYIVCNRIVKIKWLFKIFR